MTSTESPAEDETVSASGGSARSQLYELRDRSWAPRPIAGLTIAAIAFVTPIMIAVAAVQIAARFVPRPSGAIGLTVWLLGLVAVATATMWSVDRLSRRLLPLAAILRLSLVFPDGAPSRFAVALKSGSGKALERSLQRGDTDAEFATGEGSAALVVGLLGALSAHDRLTRGHSERVRAYSDLIADELELDADSRSKLHWAALLHDVGKLDVPAAILNKTDQLTADEWNAVRRHPGASDKWLVPVREWLGEWALAASEHHERYDGDGYPKQLRGDEISLAGRIVAVADAFDVMTSARSYKKPYPAAQARVELANNAGTQFDPRVVRAFLAVSLDKLRLVMGPLAWLSGLSGLFSIGSVASAGAAAASAMVVAASALAVPAVASPHHDHRPVVAAAANGSTNGDGSGRRRDDSQGEVRSPVVDVARPATGVAADPIAGAKKVAAATPVHPVAVPSKQDHATDGSTPAPPPDARHDPNLATPGSTPVPAPTTVPVTTPSTAPPRPPAPNHVPSAAADVFVSSSKDISVDVLANDVDADGNLQRSSLTLVSVPSGGDARVRLKDGKVRVQVDKHASETVTFTYRICDATDLCADANVTITFHDAR